MGAGGRTTEEKMRTLLRDEARIAVDHYVTEMDGMADKSIRGVELTVLLASVFVTVWGLFIAGDQPEVARGILNSAFVIGLVASTGAIIFSLAAYDRYLRLEGSIKKRHTSYRCRKNTAKNRQQMYF